MDLQEALSVMEEQLAAARTAATLPIVEQLNATIREHADAASVAPSYELVGTIPVLDGEKPEAVARFFQSVDDVGELSRWGNDEKLRVAKLKLTGAVLKFVDAEDQSQLRTYDDLRKVITERFSDKTPQQFYFQQLAMVQQRRGESIEAFADRVKALTEKTVRVTNNAEVNKALREEGDRRALEAFQRGLFGRVGEQTRLKFPPSLREAVTTAIAIEHLLQSNQSVSAEKRVFHSDVICFKCHQKGHVSRDCTAKVNPPASPQGRVVCWRCKKVGHRQRDCRVKLNFNRNPQQGNGSGVSGDADTNPRS